jgi:hypothetical protein
MSALGLFDKFFDDAAVFPPGNLPLVDALPAHARHRSAVYGSTVGPFVVAARDLPHLAAGARGIAPASLRLSVTVPLPDMASAVRQVTAIPAVELVGIEPTLPDGLDPADIAGLLGGAPEGVPVFVEAPRDQRRTEVIDALAGAGVSAKIRTGGVRAGMYPGETELAEAIISLARRDVAFKATAGLHHAMRNTDGATGFEQHGFLNLLVATGLARADASVADVRDVLADRDAPRLAATIEGLDPATRDGFRSFGTCDLREPIDELVALDLLPRNYASEPAE